MVFFMPWSWVYVEGDSQLRVSEKMQLRSIDYAHPRNLGRNILIYNAEVL